MNLFLGHFVPKEGHPNLWDLPTDYLLHNADPRHRIPVKSYTKWWSDPIAASDLESSLTDYGQRLEKESLFVEYYRPKQFTTFANLFAFDMMSTMTRCDFILVAHVYRAMLREDMNDLSPFSVRVNLSHPTRYVCTFYAD